MTVSLLTSFRNEKVFRSFLSAINKRNTRNRLAWFPSNATHAIYHGRHQRKANSYFLTQVTQATQQPERKDGRSVYSCVACVALEAK